MSDIVSEISTVVAKKVGIPQDKAKQSVVVVIDMLKKKLPPTVAGQLDAVLEGKIDLSDGIGELLGNTSRKSHPCLRKSSCCSVAS